MTIALIVVKNIVKDAFVLLKTHTIKGHPKAYTYILDLT